MLEPISSGRARGSPQGDAAARLSQLWQQGPPPDLRAFVAGQALTPGQLASVVRVDQRERWRVGQRLPAEHYLRDFLSLQQELEAGLEVIYAEFLLRKEQGESPDPAEYYQRFPAFAERLRMQMQLHDALASETGGVEHTRSQPGPAAGPSALPSTLPRPFRPHQQALPEKFGRYRIVKLLGRGGMGSVYLARDSQLGDRPVALKVPLLHPGQDPSFLNRFHREAKAAAALTHPNICPVHDVGELEGVIYLTMAYIEGQPLNERLRSGPRPSIAESASLVSKLALALDEAHQRGIIHRDLKPGNIMIDQRHQPVIMDFGLARHETPGAERLTQSGEMLGTPAYMSPEQVAGDVNAMGPGCDIYSLGVILYELVTGQLPFSGPCGAILAKVLTEEPPTPASLRPDLDPRLDAICRRAMCKRPADRFRSMKEFAAALEPALRQPASSAVSGSKTIRASATPMEKPAPRRRRRAALLVGMLLLAGLAGVAAWQRDELMRMLGAGPATEQAMRDVTTSTIPDRPTKVDARKTTKKDEIAELKANKEEPPEPKTKKEVPPETKTKKEEPPEPQKPPPKDEVGLVRIIHPGFKASSVAFLADGRRALMGGSVAADENKKASLLLYDVDAGKLLRGYELLPPDFDRWAALEKAKGRTTTTDELRQLWSGRMASISSFNVLPDDKQALVKCVSGVSSLRLLDLESGQEVRRFQTADLLDSPVFACLSADGGRAFSANIHAVDKGSPVLRAWDVLTGKEIAHSQPLYSSFARPETWGDGSRLLLPCSPIDAIKKLRGEPQVQVWDTGKMQMVGQLKGVVWPATNLMATPDGRLAISGAAPGGKPQVWDLVNGKELIRLEGHPDSALAVAISADGGRALTGGAGRQEGNQFVGDFSVRLWELPSGKLLHRFEGHQDRVGQVAFSPDGRRALSASQDGTVRLWRLPDPPHTVFRNHDLGVQSVAFSPNGRLALCGSGGKGEPGAIYLWDTQTQQQVFRLEQDASTGKKLQGVHRVGFAPDAQKFFASTGDHSLRVWNKVGKQLGVSPPASHMILAAAFATDQDLLFAEPKEIDKQFGHQLRLWRPNGPEQPDPYLTNRSRANVMCLAISADGRRALTGSFNGRVSWWDVPGRKEIRQLQGFDDPVLTVAFSSDGRRVLAGSRGGAVKTWDADTGQLLLTQQGPTRDSLTRCVAFSPDGRRVLTGSGKLPFDKTPGPQEHILYLWELETGKVLQAFKGHTGAIWCVAFSPAGQRALSGSEDRTMRLWELPQ